MAANGLTRSESFLLKAAAKHFRREYAGPPLAISEEIDPKLRWRPSLHFKPSNDQTIAAEASETPYPEIFRLRHADILDVHMPISVYCICPEETFLDSTKQREVRDLQSHGYGLLTVDHQGKVLKRFGCIPLVQHISKAEFEAEIRDIPKKIQLRLKEAFDTYCQNAGSGVKELTEIVEGIVLNVGKKVAKRGWIDRGILKKGSASKILDAMLEAKQCRNALHSIAGARSYIKDYRHIAHHFPRNKRQAYTKYRTCQHAFREGIKRIRSFRDALKHLGMRITV